MATTTTLTMPDTTTREYEPRWHERYDKDSNNAAVGVEVCELTDGDSIIRTEHGVQSRGTIEKHHRSVEDIVLQVDGVTTKIGKISVTMTYLTGDRTMQDRVKDVGLAYFAHLAVEANLLELLRGRVNRQ